MLLTITTTAVPATDLGYLLHKNPARAHVFARPHAAQIAQAVLVPRDAIQQQRQRFDTSMGMGGRTFCFARLHVDRAEVVEEDEGADSLVLLSRNGATDFETVAFQGAECGMD